MKTIDHKRFTAVMDDAIAARGLLDAMHAEREMVRAQLDKARLAGKIQVDDRGRQVFGENPQNKAMEREYADRFRRLTARHNELSARAAPAIELARACLAYARAARHPGAECYENEF